MTFLHQEQWLRVCLHCLQLVIAANGHHKVPFEDLLVAGTVGWKVSGF